MNCYANELLTSAACSAKRSEAMESKNMAQKEMEEKSDKGG